MKPKRMQSIKIILSIIIMLIFGYISYTQAYFYKSLQNPFSSQTKFKYIYYAASDDNNNIYRIDQSQQRVTKTSPDGKLEFEIDIKPNSTNTKSYFSSLAIGNNDTIYVKQVTKSISLYSSSELMKEEIIRYDTTDFLQRGKTVYETSSTQAQEKISSMTFKNGSLYFVESTDSGEGKTVALNKISPMDEESCPVKKYFIPNKYYINKVIGVYPDIIYFTGKKGEIYEVSISSSHIKKLFPLTKKVNMRTNPVLLAVDESGRIVYADEGQRNISLLTGSKERILLSEKTFRHLLSIKGMEDIFLFTKALSVNGNTAICIISDNVVSISNIESKSLKGIHVNIVSAKASYKGFYIFKRLTLWCFPIVTVGLFLYLFCLLYKYYIRRGLMRKQTVVFIGSMVIIFSFISYVFFVQINSVLTDKIRRQLDSKVTIGARQLNMADFESIKRTSDFKNPSYKRLSKYISDIQRDNVRLYKSKRSSVGLVNDIFRSIKSIPSLISGNFKLSMPEENFYSILYKVDDMGDNKYVFNMCVTDDDHRSPFYPYFVPNKRDRLEYYKTVSETNKNLSTKFFLKSSDSEGDYLFTIKPMRSIVTGKITGLYEIGIDRAALTKRIYMIYMNTVPLLLLVLLICIGLMYLLTYRLLVPLKQLKEGVERLDGKTWDYRLSINTGDELESLSNSFNEMNTTLEQHIKQIEETKKAYARFVPNQINKYLNESNIVNIKLKDQNTLSTYTMISNIRSFYALSRKMTAQENFDFINDYLCQVGPIINEYQGFINKFLGYGLMALFPEPNKADLCLRAALLMQHNILEYNKILESCGKQTFEIGIAVHRCERLILGIVGFKSESEDRLEAAIIDEGVTLTESLEKASQKLGASILVTEDIIKNIHSPSVYKYRYLGMISFENINGAVNIYDVYQEDNEVIRGLKENTKADFEKAVMLYQEQKFEEAKEIFIDVIGINNKDEAAKIYFFLCDEYIKRKPKNWSKDISL